MDYNMNPTNPFDDGVYETGRTQPPKKRGGVIAVLLVFVILLCGVTSALSILNAQLFQQLTGQEADQVDISFHSGEESDLPTLETFSDPSAELNTGGVSLDLKDTPLAVDNRADADQALSWQEIYEKNIPSVVSITCTLPGGSSSGTGVIFNEEGFIVTNCHVVEDAQEIIVLLSDDRRFTARLVGADQVSDLAVLYIEATGLTPAEFGSSAALQVGDAVAAIGDPLGVELRGTMTDGIISAINRDISVNGRTMTLIQTNAALNSGNSGGPLINCYGQVIGINTMKISAFTDEAGVEGLGFAIPSTTVKEIVDQLMEQGFVSGRPTMGITCQELTAQQQRYYRLPDGLYITDVESGSPAGTAGIAKGDLLMSIDGVSLDSLDEFNSVLYSHQVGDSVQVIIYRSGRQYAVTLTLTEDKG